MKSEEVKERPRLVRGRGWRWGAVLVLVALVSGSLGCAQRYVRETFMDEPDLKIRLRAAKKGGDFVERGLAHPATISAVRMANILSRIDVRMDDEEGRRNAIATDILFDLAAGLSRALGAANTFQEVVVQSIRRSRRLGVFTEKHMTGLVAWVQGDELVLSLTHIDIPIEKGRREKLPEPWTDRPSGNFRVISAPHIVPVATNTVLVAWREQAFRKATNLRVDATGRVRRREILLEEPPDEAPASATPLPEGLTPEILRALADLEEERRDGKISEGQYQRRRRALLRGETPR